MFDRLKSLENSKKPSAEGSDSRSQGRGRPAAVLAPLVLPHWDSPQRDAKLLYIKRSSKLKKHAGQMAFPGGVRETEDCSLLATGFREAFEEVALEEQSTEVLAALPSASTPSGFWLQPYFVATIQQKFVSQEMEVESIHLIDVEELLNCPVRLERKTYLEDNHRVIYFDTSSVCIWGITGRITEIILRQFFSWEPPQ